MGGFELFALRVRAFKWVLGLPFLAVVALKTLVYAAIAATLLVAGPAAHLAGVETAYEAQLRARTVGFSLLVASVFVTLLQAAGRVGYRTFLDFLLGRSRRPRSERRFFLFVDVVGSTSLAARLGPLSAHRFLAAVFATVAEPIAAWHGEI